MTQEEIEAGFHRAMLGVYESALRECGYRATRFRKMVVDRGGLDTARALLASPDVVPDGFNTLYLAGRLDLSLEAVVVKESWRQLFTDAELNVAADRLRKVGFTVE